MMNIERYKSDLMSIENSFEEIRLKHDIDGNLRNIKKCLVRIFAQDFNLSIVENKGNFFGMSVYPTEATCEKLIDSLVNAKSTMDEIEAVWKANNDWDIEIDSLLFNRFGIQANSKELTAILLHEIGHTVCERTIPNRLFKVIRYQIAKTDRKTKELCKDNKFRIVFLPTILSTCAYKMFSYDGIEEEMNADKLVVDFGYGASLRDFLEKLIKFNGNRLMDRNEDDAEKDLKIMTKWSIENIGELRYRMDKLNSELSSQIKKSESNYVRRLLTNMKNKLFPNVDKSKYEAAVTEACLIKDINNANRRAEEAIVLEFFNKKTKKLNKIQMSDIDYLVIKLDDIENQDDKIYLLDLIYYQMEMIDTALNLIKNGERNRVQNSEQELLDMQKQLREMRLKVIKTKIPEKNFGLFIKYPKGYEG